MGQLLSFALQSGIISLFMYVIYKELLSNENQFRFNRAILLTIYALSVVVPLCNMLSLLAEEPVTLATATVSDFALASAVTTISEPVAVPFSPWRAILWIYLIGMAFVAITTIFTFLLLTTTIIKGEKIKRDGYTIVLTDSNRFAPFSWLRYIVVNRNEYGKSGDIIMLHERQHIRCCHWFDLLIAQVAIIIGWFNPATWLLRKELQSVHEYEADYHVLQHGADPCEYQMFLLEKAVGAAIPSLANSINHSKIKNRIIMMNSKKSSAMRRIRAIAFVPVIGLALFVTTIPSVASTLSAAESTAVFDNDAVSDSIQTFEAVLSLFQNEDKLIYKDDLKYFVDGELVVNKDDVPVAENIASVNVEQGEVHIITKTEFYRDEFEKLEVRCVSVDNDGGTNVVEMYTGLKDFRVLSAKIILEDKTEYECKVEHRYEGEDKIFVTMHIDEVLASPDVLVFYMQLQTTLGLFESTYYQNAGVITDKDGNRKVVPADSFEIEKMRSMR